MKKFGNNKHKIKERNKHRLLGRIVKIDLTWKIVNIYPLFDLILLILHFVLFLFTLFFLSKIKEIFLVFLVLSFKRETKLGKNQTFLCLKLKIIYKASILEWIENKWKWSWKWRRKDIETKTRRKWKNEEERKKDDLFERIVDGGCSDFVSFLLEKIKKINKLWD